MYKCPSCGNNNLFISAMVDCCLDHKGIAHPIINATGRFDDGCEIYCNECGHRGIPSTFRQTTNIPESIKSQIDSLHSFVYDINKRLKRLEHLCSTQQ